MSTVQRSPRNVARKPARSTIVVLIVGAALGIFLSLSVIDEAIEDEATAAADTVGTSLTVRAEGRGSGGGFFGTTPDPIAVDLIPLIELTDGVTSVDAVATQTIRPQFDRSSGIPPDREALWAGFLTVQGMTTSGEPFLADGSDCDLVGGRGLVASADASMVMVIGAAAADYRSLDLGDAFDINGDAYEVVGIFTSSTFSGNTTAIVLFKPMIATWNLSGPTSLVVEASGVGVVSAVQADRQTLVGEDREVVTASNTETETLQAHIDASAGSSSVGAWLALSTGVIVLVFLMALVTRERAREVGVMKALGFGSGRIIQQFIAESLALAAAGFVVALLFALVAGPALPGMLVESTRDDAEGGSDSSDQLPAADSGGRRGGGFLGGATAATGTSSLEEVAFRLTPQVLLTTLATAMDVGALGALYPVTKAVRLQPAEALRHE